MHLLTKAVVLLIAGGKYRFRGLSQPNVVLMLKHYGFKTVAKGYRFVEFANGDRIDIHYPGWVRLVGAECPLPCTL